MGDDASGGPVKKNGKWGSGTVDFPDALGEQSPFATKGAVILFRFVATVLIVLSYSISMAHVGDTSQLAMTWKPVLGQSVKPYDETVSVTIRDVETNTRQTIVSNRTHPYFVQIPGAAEQKIAVNSSEGHVYNGDIPSGSWIYAANLQPGYLLLNDDNSWAEVEKVEVEAKPLQAYNLTVADYHTYFVAANDNAAPVWVHNDCNTRLQRLSDPQPSIIPKQVKEAYEDILIGRGTPRIDPTTGQQTVFQGREAEVRRVWTGALEYDVPGTNHRVLQKTLPDGRTIMGYVVGHDYRVVRTFPAPWYPDGGSIPGR
jgi:hypothetical protein